MHRKRINALWERHFPEIFLFSFEVGHILVQCHQDGQIKAMHTFNEVWVNLVVQLWVLPFVLLIIYIHMKLASGLCEFYVIKDLFQVWSYSSTSFKKIQSIFTSCVTLLLPSLKSKFPNKSYSNINQYSKENSMAYNYRQTDSHDCVISCRQES